MTSSIPAAPRGTGSEGRLGWRVFSLGDDGALLPPFLARYWTDKARPGGEPWSRATTRARCLVADHGAPAAGCTCGLRATEDLDELLAAVTKRATVVSSVCRSW